MKRITNGYEILERFVILFLKRFFYLSHVNFGTRNDQSDETAVVRSQSFHTLVQLFGKESSSVVHAFYYFEIIIRRLSLKIRNIREEKNVWRIKRHRVRTDSKETFLNVPWKFIFYSSFYGMTGYTLVLSENLFQLRYIPLNEDRVEHRFVGSKSEFACTQQRDTFKIHFDYTK